MDLSTDATVTVVTDRVTTLTLLLESGTELNQTVAAGTTTLTVS